MCSKATGDAPPYPVDPAAVPPDRVAARAVTPWSRTPLASALPRDSVFVAKPSSPLFNAHCTPHRHRLSHRLSAPIGDTAPLSSSETRASLPLCSLSLASPSSFHSSKR